MSAIDKFREFLAGPDQCAEDAFAITPHDVNELPYVVRRIYVGTGGDIKVITKKGTTVTHKDFPAQSYLDGLSIRAVLFTGTTASNMVGYI